MELRRQIDRDTAVRFAQTTSHFDPDEDDFERETVRGPFAGYVRSPFPEFNADSRAVLGLTPRAAGGLIDVPRGTTLSQLCTIS